MENYSDFEFEHPEVEEDALSLCDLPLNDCNDDGESDQNPIIPASSSSDPEDFFEFCVDPIRGYFPMDVVFCGKSIPCSKPITNPTTQEPQIKNPFFSRSESFKFSQSSSPPAHSSSTRLPGSEHSPATANFRSQSSNSRKHKVLIGLVKYQPEMDIIELRKRQARRAPSAMFPVNNGGEKAVVGSGKSGGKGHWGLMRPLRCPSHLLSALAKATLGCMPHV